MPERTANHQVTYNLPLEPIVEVNLSPNVFSGGPAV